MGRKFGTSMHEYTDVNRKCRLFFYVSEVSN